MNQIGTPMYSIDQIAGEYLKQRQTTTNPSSDSVSFEQILLGKQSDYEAEITSNVVFSKHASERLNSRNIELDASQLQRLNDGVEQARNKNINESLVMMDNLAFIVNVDSNTVVTAMTQGSESSHVFTNIDGAVII
jgi:flagellar operon protein